MNNPIKTAGGREDWHLVHFTVCAHIKYFLILGVLRIAPCHQGLSAVIFNLVSLRQIMPGSSNITGCNSYSAYLVTGMCSVLGVLGSQRGIVVC